MSEGNCYLPLGMSKKISTIIKQNTQKHYTSKTVWRPWDSTIAFHMPKLGIKNSTLAYNLSLSISQVRKLPSSNTCSNLDTTTDFLNWRMAFLFLVMQTGGSEGCKFLLAALNYGSSNSSRQETTKLLLRTHAPFKGFIHVERIYILKGGLYRPPLRRIAPDRGPLDVISTAFMGYTTTCI